MQLRDLCVSVVRVLRNPRATLTIKGKVTIQKSVRNPLRFKAGDLPDFVIADHDDAVPGSVNGIRELRGMLKVRRRAVSVDEMNAAVLREHTSKR
jgi:hypothetical protein